jgi:hypothetical protein
MEQLVWMCGRRAGDLAQDNEFHSRRLHRLPFPRRPSPANLSSPLFARVAADPAGTSAAFGLAVGVILVWGSPARPFQFGDTWQPVINTGTTIVTFLMVFLLQRAQYKDARAMHLKLNELVVTVILLDRNGERGGQGR